MLKNFFLFSGENHSPDYLHKRLQGGEIFPSPAPWKKGVAKWESFHTPMLIFSV